MGRANGNMVGSFVECMALVLGQSLYAIFDLSCMNYMIANLIWHVNSF